MVHNKTRISEDFAARLLMNQQKTRTNNHHQNKEVSIRGDIFVSISNRFTVECGLNGPKMLNTLQMSPSEPKINNKTNNC